MAEEVKAASHNGHLVVDLDTLKKDKAAIAKLGSS